MIRIITLMTAVFILSATVFSYPEKWGPFERGDEPELFPVSECYELKESFCRETGELIKIYGVSEEDNSPRVKVRADADGVFVSVAAEKGEIRSGPDKVMTGNFADPLFFPPALTGDLNNDGTPDFVVRVWFGGLGLASSGMEMVFILSEGDTYRVTSFYDMSPSKTSFVDLKGDGTCRYVHTSFVFGGSEPSIIDGRVRNFWVYNLLEINGSQIITNNEIDSRFPGWVWFTYGPNHKDTVHLTDGQKERLWDEHAEHSGKSRTFLLRR